MPKDKTLSNALHRRALAFGQRPLGLRAGIEFESIGSFSEWFDFETPSIDSIRDAQSGIAIVKIEGMIYHRDSCGFSYDDYENLLDGLAQDDQVSAILLDIDSPGGHTSGNLDFARKVSSIDKPVWALARDDACSSAYAIACAADRVFATSQAFVGSIGCVFSMINWAQSLENDGLKPIIVRSGAKKFAPNHDEPVTEQQLQDLQADIDQLAQGFAAFVAERRGQTADHWLALEGAAFLAPQGLDLGLIDEISTKDDVLAQMIQTFASGPRVTATDPSNAPSGVPSPAKPGSKHMPPKPNSAAANKQSFSIVSARIQGSDFITEGHGLEVEKTYKFAVTSDGDVPGGMTAGGVYDFVATDDSVLTVQGVSPTSSGSGVITLTSHSDVTPQTIDPVPQDAGIAESAATAERERIASIVGSVQATGRTNLAEYFAFKTKMPAADAIAALENAARDEAGAGTASLKHAAPTLSASDVTPTDPQAKRNEHWGRIAALSGGGRRNRNRKSA